MVIRKATVKQKIRRPCSIPPGHTIKELAEERGITNNELAAKMNISTQNLSNLIVGEVELTRDIACSLQEIFNVEVSFWMNLEYSYRSNLCVKP